LQNNQFKPVQQSRQEDQKNIVDQKQIDITAVFQPAAKASYSAGLNIYPCLALTKGLGFQALQSSAPTQILSNLLSFFRSKMNNLSETDRSRQASLSLYKTSQFKPLKKPVKIKPRTVKPRQLSQRDS